MPGFDGTGPAGQGPMTGGARGYCGSAAIDAGGRSIAGRGFYGRGGGRGRRNCFYATGTPGWMRSPRSAWAFGSSKENELAALKDQAGYLQDELNAIQSRVKDLEGK